MNIGYNIYLYNENKLIFVLSLYSLPPRFVELISYLKHNKFKLFPIDLEAQNI